VVHEDAQRSYAREQHVHSQIEFKTINKIGLMKVPLCNVMFVNLNPVVVSGEENTLSLAAVFWFYDESLCLPVVELLFERFQVCREHPRPRKKLEFAGEVFLHREQIFSQ
jgi:hypothetical protein